jgi:thioredoxin reductase
MAVEPEAVEVQEIRTLENGLKPYNTIIVGAGTAGIGVTIALQHAGVEDYLLVDRAEVGSSFAAWPAETRFITPSFPSNSIGMLDLNSIAIGVSPAYNMRVEHPTGAEYAEHLQNLVNYFELSTLTLTNITSIEKNGDVFHLKTDTMTLVATNVIWAAGEYQYPSQNAFTGSELGRHNSTVAKYGDLEGDDFLIIGGYESGIDAAYHLAKSGKKVKVFDINCPWGDESSDPSIALSTFSYERMLHPSFEENVELFSETSIKSITFDNDTYELTTEDGRSFKSKVQPLMASGFEGGHKFVDHLFEQREDGFPLLTERDESTIVPGMFLCGPAVRHEREVFCFIYKYRQRFGIVAEAIASSLDIPTEEFIKAYRGWGMYLDDLSCCGQECLTC